MEDQERGWSLGYNVFSRYRSEIMGISMLWIMMFHVFYITPATPWLRNLKGIGFLGVDIFIFLSALGLSLSWSRRKQNYGHYLKRRLIRIMPTYWLVTGCYGLFLRLLGATSLKTIFWTTSTLFYWLNKPHYFNWYIPALLFFYLLLPACTALLARVKHRGWLVAGLCLLVFPLFHLMAMHGVSNFNGVILRIPVFLLGILVGIFIAQDRRLSPKELWLWAALPFLVPVLKPLARPYYLHTCMSFAFGCVAVCLLLAGLAAVLPKGVGWFLKLLGRCSLEIYLLNVILVLERDRLTAWISLDAPFFCALTVTANILLGVMLHYVLEKPLAWLTAKVTGSESPSHPPKEGGYSAGDRSGR